MTTITPTLLATLLQLPGVTLQDVDALRAALDKMQRGAKSLTRQEAMIIYRFLVLLAERAAAMNAVQTEMSI